MGGLSRVVRLALAGCLAAVAAVAGFGRAAGDERIVGGGRADIGQHEYVVFLATPEGFQFCGGTLVTGDRVVTAAHCVSGRGPGDLRVVAGRADKQSNAGRVAQVRAIWVHPGFAGVRTGADIAVLALAHRLPYRPIGLATGDPALHRPGREGLILGWGRTSESSQPSRYLMRAAVPLVSDRACGQAYSAFRAASMICAGFQRGGVDACQGDSGGPLVVGSRLVGITSWGEGCAEPGKPGVYTRVAAYADLVASHI